MSGGDFRVVGAPRDGPAPAVGAADGGGRPRGPGRPPAPLSAVDARVRRRVRRRRTGARQPAGRTPLQPDGNLVTYAADGRAVWNAGTAGSAATHLVLQDDGNLVLYRDDGGAVWSTGQDTPTGCARGSRSTSARGSPRPAAGPAWSTRPTGNAVVYGPGGRPIWFTGATWGQSRLTLQADGNLVVYGGNGQALWDSTHPSGRRGHPSSSSRTTATWCWPGPTGGPCGRPARTPRTGCGPGSEFCGGQALESPNSQYRAVQQADGNLVVYAPGSRVLWHAGTYGNGGAHVAMQPDGNLVVSGVSGRAVWHAGHVG